MKRLTKIYPSGSYGIVGDIDDAVHRLAAIEDILGDEYELDRLRELWNAVYWRQFYPIFRGIMEIEAQWNTF